MTYFSSFERKGGSGDEIQVSRERFDVQEIQLHPAWRTHHLLRGGRNHA